MISFLSLFVHILVSPFTMQATTTSFEHICPWTKIHWAIGRSKASARSQRGRSLADFIINTAEYGFR